MSRHSKDDYKQMIGSMSGFVFTLANIKNYVYYYSDLDLNQDCTGPLLWKNIRPH